MRQWLCLAIISTSLLWFTATEAVAQECKDALVVSTYNMTYRGHTDWRLSRIVSKDSWQTIHDQAGVQALLYGIPVGASYEDYQARSNEYYDQTRVSLTQDELTNIAWTGLEPNAVSAYSKCLNSEVFAADGLHAAVQYATDQDVTILIRWHRTGVATALGVSWLPADTFQGVRLPTTIPDGLTTVRVPRPAKAIQLVANGSGFTTGGIVITPPPPPPPIPSFTCYKSLPLTVQDRGHVDNYNDYYAYCNGEPWRYTLKKERWNLTDSDNLVDADAVPPTVGDITIKVKVADGVVKLEPRSCHGETRGNFSLKVKYSTPEPCP